MSARGQMLAMMAEERTLFCRLEARIAALRAALDECCMSTPEPSVHAIADAALAADIEAERMM